MVAMLRKCRVCGGEKFETIMSLGHQVMTGTFPKSEEEDVTGGPVDLVRCSIEKGCGLVQLEQSYDLSEMYGLNYGYRSGLNASMVSHLHSKVDKISPEKVKKEISSVIKQMLDFFRILMEKI